MVVGGELPFFYRRCEASGNVPGHKKGTGGENGHASTGLIFATLVHYGHDAERLQYYTERQLYLYYKQALNLQKINSHRALLDIHAGTAGGSVAQNRLKKLKVSNNE